MADAFDLAANAGSDPFLDAATETTPVSNVDEFDIAAIETDANDPFMSAANDATQQPVDVAQQAQQITESYNPFGLQGFESPEQSARVLKLEKMRYDIPEVDVTAPDEAKAFAKQKSDEYRDALSKESIEVKALIERNELAQRYERLRKTWFGRDNVPDAIRSEMEEINSNLNITDSGFENRVLSGRAKNFYDRVRMSQYSTHTEQQLGMQFAAGDFDTVDRNNDKLNKMQLVSSQTMPEGKRFLSKAGYGVLSNIAPMGESIAAGATTPGGIGGKAYWAAQGKGSIIRTYLSDNNIKAADMSEEQRDRLNALSNTGGAVYAAIEQLGSMFGLQGAGLDKVIAGKLIGKAMVDDAFFKQVMRGGARFAISWMLESGEEGLQKLTEEISAKGVDGNYDWGEIANKSFTEFKEAIPSTFGITAVMGGASKMSNARKVNKIAANLQKNGMGATEAKNRAKLMLDADTKEEFDKIKEETEVAAGIKSSNEDIIRMGDLVGRRLLTEDERKEFNELMRRMSPLDTIDAEEARLMTDLEELSGKYGDILRPDQIDNKMKYGDEDLKRTAARLTELYGREVTPKEVKDALIEPMDKVDVSEKAQKEAKEKELSDVQESYTQWKKLDLSTEEMIEKIRAIDSELADEFKERTTGKYSEKASVVMRDIINKINQEATDGDTKRESEATELETDTKATAETATEEGADTGTPVTGQAEEVQQVEAEQKEEVDQKPKTSKIKQAMDKETGVKKPVEKVTVNAKTLIKELFRVQQRASRQGKKAGIAEIKQKLRDFKGDAQELVDQFKEQMEGLKNATQLERSQLRNALKDIQIAKTTEGQQKAFDKAVDKLESTFAAIEERTPKYEYRPFDAPNTISGVDENSSYQDIRSAYINLGGDKTVRSAKEMLKYANKKAVSNLNGIEYAGDVGKQVRANIKTRNVGGKAKIFDKIFSTRAMSSLLNGDTFGGILSNGDDRVKKLFTEDVRNSREKAEALRVDWFRKTKLDKKASRLLDKKYKITIGGKQVNVRGSVLAYLVTAQNNEDTTAAVEHYELDIGKAKGVRIDNLAELVDSLPQELVDASKSWGDMWGQLSGEMGPTVKNVYDIQQQRIGGKAVFELVDDYLPHNIKTDGKAEELFDEDGKPVSDTAINRTMYSNGRWKSRTGLGSKDSVMTIPDVYSMMFRQINDASLFSGMAPVITEINDVIKGNAGRIRGQYGKHFYKNLGKLVERMQGVSTWVDESAVLQDLLSREVVLHLSRPSTMLRMSSSLLLTPPYLNNPVKSFLYAGSIKPMAVKNKINEEMNKSGIFVARHTTGATPELAEGGSRAFMRGISRNGTYDYRNIHPVEAFKKAKNLDAPMESIRAMVPSGGDLLAVRGIFEQAIGDVMADENVSLKDINSELLKRDDVFWDKVRKKAEDLTGQTQPSNYDEHRSAMHGSGRTIMMRIVTRYGTQMNKIFNNLVQESDNAIKTGDYKKLTEVATTSLVVMALVNTVIKMETKALYKFWRKIWGIDDDEPEEVDEEKFFSEFGYNLAKMSASTIEGGDELFRIGELLKTKYKGGYAHDANIAPIGDTFIDALSDGFMRAGRIAKNRKLLEDNFKTEKSGRRKVISAKERERMKEQMATDTARLFSDMSTLSGAAFKIPTPFFEQAAGTREAAEKLAREYYDVD